MCRIHDSLRPRVVADEEGRAMTHTPSCCSTTALRALCSCFSIWRLIASSLNWEKFQFRSGWAAIPVAFVHGTPFCCILVTMKVHVGYFLNPLQPAKR